ncbi:MAG: hypothetical protein BGO43_12040 [Gammaproteobacteria bacterium 39-13]|nr:hypothetical protein [Gammaproteobacteria bacterium]OJV89735.1 MAG: hypothetical protein BGO43_12040 [Gammaproteobacteria bacterium 39-13]
MNSYTINKKSPQILSLAGSRVGEWVDSSWKWLTKLRSAALRRFQNNIRHSSRTIRYEQRVAIAEVLKVLFSYLDLNTMCVGIYHRETDAFVHLSLDFIAKKAGLNIRRAQRAMSWLYQSGYVAGYRQSFYDIDTEEYYHKPSIRRVNSKLLFDLGITEFALQRARNRSKNKFHDILLKSLSSKNQSSKSNKQNSNDIKNILNGLSQAFALPKHSKSQSSESTYNEKLKKLMDLMPNLTIYEAQRMLPKAH